MFRLLYEKPHALFIVIFIVWGLFIRVSDISAWYFSPDDILHLLIAKHSNFIDVIEHNRFESHPLGIYSVLFIMQKISSNEIFLRSVSIIPGIVFIPLSYLLVTKLLKSRVAGVISSFIATFSIPIVIQSQTIRQYMFGLVWIYIALYCFHIYLENRSRTRLLVFGLFGSLSIFFHHAVIFLLVPYLLMYFPFTDYLRKQKKDMLVVLFSLTTPFLVFFFNYIYQKDGWNFHRDNSIREHEWIASGYHESFLSALKEIPYIIIYFSPPVIFLFFMTSFFWGCVLSILYRRKVFIFCVLSFVIPLILSIQKLYPFYHSRHSIHLILIVQLLISIPFVYLSNYFKLIKRNLFVMSLILLSATFLIFTQYVQSNFYRDSSIAGLIEFPLSKAAYYEVFETIDKNSNEKKIIITDAQGGLYVVYRTSLYNNKTLLRKIGYTTYNDTPVYFLNKWGSVHTKEDYLFTLSSASSQDFKIYTVFFLGLGWWRNYQNFDTKYLIYENDTHRLDKIKMQVFKFDYDSFMHQL